MHDARSTRGLATVAVFAGVTLAAACTPGEPPAPQPSEEQPPAMGEARRESPGARPDPATLLPNGMEPFDGILIGGQPTPDQIRNLRGLGYRAIVNLRVEDEEGSTRREDVEALGMEYIALPVSGAADVTEEKARALAAVLAQAGTPLVVQCASGNRVGALFALKAFHVDGRSPGEALQVGKAAGLTRLEPEVRRQLGLPVPGP